MIAALPRYATAINDFAPTIWVVSVVARSENIVVDRSEFMVVYLSKLIALSPAMGQDRVRLGIGVQKLLERIISGVQEPHDG